MFDKEITAKIKAFHETRQGQNVAKHAQAFGTGAITLKQALEVTNDLAPIALVVWWTSLANVGTKYSSQCTKDIHCHIVEGILRFFTDECSARKLSESREDMR